MVKDLFPKDLWDARLGDVAIEPRGALFINCGGIGASRS